MVPGATTCTPSPFLAGVSPTTLRHLFISMRFECRGLPLLFFDVAVKRKGGMVEKELFHIVQHSLFVALKMNVSRYAMTFFTLLYRGKEKEKENEKKRSRMIR